MRRARGPSWAPREGGEDGDAPDSPVRLVVLRRHLKGRNAAARYGCPEGRGRGFGAFGPAIGTPGGQGPAPFHDRHDFRRIALPEFQSLGPLQQVGRPGILAKTRGFVVAIRAISAFSWCKYMFPAKLSAV